MTGRAHRARLFAAALSMCALTLAACGGAGGGGGAGTGTRSGGGAGSAASGTMTEQEVASLERILSGAENAAADAERLPGPP